MALKDFWNSQSSAKGESWGVLEIVNGRVNWIWKPETKQNAFVITTKTIVSDNQWHTIKLRKIGYLEVIPMSTFIVPI